MNNMYNNKEGILKFLLYVSLFCLSLFINAAELENKEEIKIKDWEKDGGIKVMSIRKTAADYMLDFRYKVLDAEKAYLFMNRKKKAFLHVLKNGSTLQVPNTAKIGPLRQSGQLAKVGKTYFMFFGNPGRMVKSGDKVQIQIGNFKSKILSIE